MTTADRFRRAQHYGVDNAASAASTMSTTGLAKSKCRDMQRVVMRVLMEKSHDPVAAREVLEALGLDCRFTRDSDDSDDSDVKEISLLWSKKGVVA